MQWWAGRVTIDVQVSGGVDANVWHLLACHSAPHRTEEEEGGHSPFVLQCEHEFKNNDGELPTTAILEELSGSILSRPLTR